MQHSHRRVGIVGYGALGQYLARSLTAQSDRFELVWVWNRSAEKVQQDAAVKEKCVVALDDSLPAVDLIVEVAHPDLVKEYGAFFLSRADFFVGSPAAFSDQSTEDSIRAACVQHKRCCYVGAGALWGANDIRKMADSKSLQGLSVTMTKNPSHLNLQGKLLSALEEYVKSEDQTPRVLFKGSGEKRREKEKSREKRREKKKREKRKREKQKIKREKENFIDGKLTLLFVFSSVRELCPLAPNNVNTMACAALAGYNIGFDGTVGCLIADKQIQAHVVDIKVQVRSTGKCRHIFLEIFLLGSWRI